MSHCVCMLLDCQQLPCMEVYVPDMPVVVTLISMRCWLRMRWPLCFLQVGRLQQQPL
jgi:hypothetical protein